MIPTLFFIFLATLVIGLVGCFINMAYRMKNFHKTGFQGMGNTVVTHLIFGFFYVVGGIGALITGIMWLVMFLKGA